MASNPNDFSIASDFGSLSNPIPLTITLNVPGGVTMPAAGQVGYTTTVSIPAESAQLLLGKVFSSVSPSTVLLTSGNNGNSGIVRFDRGTYYIAFAIIASSTSLQVGAYLQNKRNDISQVSGGAETITFQLRPLGIFF